MVKIDSEIARRPVDWNSLPLDKFDNIFFELHQDAMTWLTGRLRSLFINLGLPFDERTELELEQILSEKTSVGFIHAGILRIPKEVDHQQRDSLEKGLRQAFSLSCFSEYMVPR